MQTEGSGTVGAAGPGPSGMIDRHLSARPGVPGFCVILARLFFNETSPLFLARPLASVPYNHR